MHEPIGGKWVEIKIAADSLYPADYDGRKRFSAISGSKSRSGVKVAPGAG
jgi:hypothetical protein